MRTLTIIVATIASISWSAPADAHNRSTWYWGSTRAELKYQEGYSVISVQCVGFGKFIRGEERVKLYRHFSCFAENENYEGSTEEDELHVTGRRGFVVYD